MMIQRSTTQDVQPSTGGAAAGRPNRSSAARTFGLLAGASLTLAGCGGDGGDDPFGMDLVSVTNGVGQLLPYTIQVIDQGVVSNEVVNIRDLETLYANLDVDLGNGVLPVATWNVNPVLSDGSPGNHYIAARFSQAIDIDSVLTSAPGAGVTNNLVGSVLITASNPTTNESTVVRGRVFIGGKTYAGVDPTTGLLELQQWVSLGSSGGLSFPVADVPEALGFPGTNSATGVAGSADLVRDDTFVFVVDEDDDLSTFEVFPGGGAQIRMSMSESVLSTEGRALNEPGVASSTLGVDGISPEIVLVPQGSSTVPQITPGNDDVDVDPATTIRLSFTEPVQLNTVGSVDNGTTPGFSSSVTVRFGVGGQSETEVLYTVRPASIYDFTQIELIPAFAFPGKGSELVPCDTFARVEIGIVQDQIQDLSGNLNTNSLSTFFETGVGAPIVNAPVAPDVIYVGRSSNSISVIDLNGFGGGTGNPTYDQQDPLKPGNTRFPLNPNLVSQGASLVPALSLGTCTIDGGSAGVFTLTRNSALDTRLISSPDLESVGDMMIGQPLDLTFNNGPPPFGCLSGSPNLCASNGLKQPTPVQLGSFSLRPAVPGQFSTAPIGSGNLISWSPHPNPPPISFPPLCFEPEILGLEPTGIDTLVTNLLVSGGNPFGNPDTSPQQPPSGLLATEQNSYFVGPGRPQIDPSACLPYQIRQQIGHFMYVIDRIRSEVVVLNSNRFTVIDRIPVADPTSLAMSPNLDLLAVSERIGNQVTFININPSSASFHTVVKRTAVGQSPQGIAWQSENEDIIVCNEGSGSISIISAVNLEVRRTVLNNLTAPFELALTPRQAFNQGLQRNVYFGFILNRDGRVGIYESGPDGTNGWGTDQVLGQAPFVFKSPKAIQLDPTELRGGCWIVHEDAIDTFTGQPLGLGGGAVSNLENESGVSGQIPLGIFAGATLASRNIELRVSASVGADTLTGIPVDIAFDDLNNLGGLISPSTPFSAGVPSQVNGKQMVRIVGTGVATNSGRYVFVAVPNSNQAGGVVDVLSVNGGLVRLDTDLTTPGIQSIPVPGAQILSSYFRQ